MSLFIPRPELSKRVSKRNDVLKPDFVQLQIQRSIQLSTISKESDSTISPSNLILKKFFYFYLFLAVLGLCCCAGFL